MAVDILAQLIVNIYEEENMYRREQFRQLRLERKLLRDTSNVLNQEPVYFKKHYRVTPEVAIRLINLVENNLIGERVTCSPPYLQVLMTLRFLAEESLQRDFAQDFNHPVSQSTASRCVSRVLNTINLLAEDLVKFPCTYQERQHIQNNFQRTIRIPGILGVVDGFLVTFKRPTDNEEAFFNYKEGHSVNVQIVVDNNYMIRNMRICPGSNNDRYIWQFSEMKECMDNSRADINILENEGRYYIIGDSGYTPSPVLLTPVVNAPEGTPSPDLLTPVVNAPKGTPAEIYTQELIKTRCVVEQTTGILTNVWKAIKRSRKAYYSPEKMALIINACVILHHFRRLSGIVDDDDINEGIDFQDNFYMNHVECGNYQEGIFERNHLIHQYYH